MAAPIVGTIARKVYRDARGRFISKAKYELSKRRDPTTGRFISKAQAANIVDTKKSEAFFEEQFGNPPAGKTWTEIVARYPGKFEDYLN